MRKFIKLLSLSILLAFSTAGVGHGESSVSPRLSLADRPVVVGAEQFRLDRTKPLVVTFFASWCPPCTAEFKNINAAIAELKNTSETGPVAFVGVNLFENIGGKENPGRMQRFLKKTSPDFPLIKGNNAVSKAFGEITRIPTVVIMDKDGREHWRFVHIRDSEKTHVTKQEILDQIKSMLGS